MSYRKINGVKKNMNGAIFYRGKSMLDGSPIVGVVTGLAAKSANPKTGAMLQTWIVPDVGVKPMEASNEGLDYSVCGDCPLRKVEGNSCYVDLSKAPRSTWEAYGRGMYLNWSDHPKDHIPVNSGLRLGSYGDPNAIHPSAWLPLLGMGLKHTGYTHQWRKPWMVESSRYLMASVEDAASRDAAKALGYRTARVTVDQNDLLQGEVVCPAIKTGGRIDCNTCNLCDGNSSGKKKPDITFPAHGSKKKNFKVPV